MKVFIQIGTNDGNDNFRKLVINNKPDLVILVEPVSYLLDRIKYNYANMQNVNIINKAIHYENNKTIQLYIPAKNNTYGTRADNGGTYTHAHFSVLPMNDWGSKDDMFKVNAETITFDKLCDDFKITDIAYLQIDTEGFDSEIIKMIDFSKYNINTLRYEKWGFSPDKFTKHNSDISYRLGSVGMLNTQNLLQSYNYKLTEITDDDGNDIIAYKGP